MLQGISNCSRTKSCPSCVRNFLTMTMSGSRMVLQLTLHGPHRISWQLICRIFGQNQCGRRPVRILILWIILLGSVWRVKPVGSITTVLIFCELLSREHSSYGCCIYLEGVQPISEATRASDCGRCSSYRVKYKES